MQHNHIHLVVEANDRAALANAMRALLIRVARGLNRVMGTRGRRVADRYHEHILATPTETFNALRYVLRNRAHHLKQWGKTPQGDDPFSSAECGALVGKPTSWLLREGWLGAVPPSSS